MKTNVIRRTAEEVLKNLTKVEFMGVEFDAYQLTAYEKGGYIDFMSMLSDEIEIGIIWDELLEYVSYHHPNATYYSMDMLEDYINSLTPYEAFEMALYSREFNMSDEYFKFNGYGNIETISDYRVGQELKDYYLNEFLEQFTEELESELEEVLEECRILLNAGF